MVAILISKLNKFPLFGALLGFLILHPPMSSAKEMAPSITSPSLAIPSINQKKIHDIYSEGEFEKVISEIDAFTKANKLYSHSDSVFIAKHLAVIYSANPATREKGKNYMFRLLALMPSAKIVDMFVSDEIDRIFEKIREEYIVRQASLGEGTPTKLESNQYAANKLSMNGNTNPSSNPNSIPMQEASAKQKKGSSHAFYWIAGGVTLAAATTGAVYFLQPKKPADRVYVLPPN
jgi:hypothetical protein